MLNPRNKGNAQVAPNKRVAPLRREQIVKTTIQCLARDGYARLTMRTLAQEAGVSQGILHYYDGHLRPYNTAMT